MLQATLRRSVWLAGGLLLSAMVSADVENRSAADEALNQLFDAAWDQDMRTSPVWASMLGDRRFNRQWHDLSSAAFDRRNQNNRAILDQLDSIDREALSPEEQVNFALFDQAYQSRLAEAAHPTHLMPISQRGGIQTLDETGNRLRLQTVQDFDDWLARLDQVDDLMDQTIALMDEGVATGFVPPKITMSRVPAQIARQVVEQNRKLARRKEV